VERLIELFIQERTYLKKRHSQNRWLGTVVGKGKGMAVEATRVLVPHFRSSLRNTDTFTPPEPTVQICGCRAIRNVA